MLVPKLVHVLKWGEKWGQWNSAYVYIICHEHTSLATPWNASPQVPYESDESWKCFQYPCLLSMYVLSISPLPFFVGRVKAAWICVASSTLHHQYAYHAAHEYHNSHTYIVVSITLAIFAHKGLVHWETITGISSCHSTQQGLHR